MTSSRLLARNSALNIVGQVAPLAIALGTIPQLVRGFGPDRFGVLTLVWATVGYFGLFEFGLGRALTQSLAERLGSARENELARVARTGLALLIVLGIVGGFCISALATPLIEHVLNVPASLHDEALASFRILGATLPFVLATVGLRGVMEAHQHFGVATMLRLPGALVTYVGPLLALPFSHSLVPAVATIAAGRLAIFVIQSAVCLRSYGYLRTPTGMALADVSGLFRFGAWMTVSSIVSPLMTYVDRFVVGSMLSLAAVTAYVTPYEAIVKVLVIPAAIVGAMLPALAATLKVDRSRAATLYDQSLRAIIALVFPAVLVVVVFAHELLRMWLGAALPAESALLLQWLAVGVFMSSVAHAPVAALHSAARPETVARLHLVELPLYAAGLLVLLRAAGLQGVAIAWAARAALDAIALGWLAERNLHLSVPNRHAAWRVCALMILLLAGGAMLTSVTSRLLYLVVALTAYISILRATLLTKQERGAVRGLVRIDGLLALAGASPKRSAPAE